MTWPDVDVIIPTYNSERTIGRCLSQIRKQKYQGRVKIKIIDGGSTDNTIKIAQSFQTDIEIKKGMYGFGKNGARYYGESVTSSQFVWNIDSDNILVEEHVLERMLSQLLEDPATNISIPFPAVDPATSSFNQWITLREIENVTKMVNCGEKVGDGFVLLTDMFYGLTNCALLRRSALEACGGYDSDVRLLIRLRKKFLSRGIIDEKSHFYHDQARSIFDYVRKWDRRIKHYASMSEEQIKNYFVDYPLEKQDDEQMKSGLIKSLFYGSIGDFRKFLTTRNKAWLWGIPYPVILTTYILGHPFKSYYVFKRFT